MCGCGDWYKKSDINHIKKIKDEWICINCEITMSRGI